MKKRNNDQSPQLFLFVNKDSKSKSLSKSEGDSAKEINRHAQQVRNRRLAAQKATTAHKSSSSARRIALGGWKKRNGEPYSPTLDAFSPDSPSAGSVWSPSYAAQTPTPISLNTSDSSSPADSSSPSATSPDEPTLTSKTPPELVVESKEQTPVVVEAVHRPDTATQPATESEVVDDFNDLSLRPYFREFSPHDQIDPFNQLPVRISSQIHEVLQQALKIYRYAGNNYKLAHLPPVIGKNINQFPIADVVQRAVTQPYHLYAFLACISIRMQNIFAAELGDAPRVFQQHASHHLRKRLMACSKNGGVDKHTLLDILYLIVSETATGAHEEARQHLKVVADLYYLLDTTQHFDFWVSETCAHVDNQLALSTGKPLIFPHTFDPGPLLPERRAALHRELYWLYNNAVQPREHYPSPISLVVPAPPRGLRDAIADFADNLDLRMGFMFDHALKLGLFTPLLAPIVNDIVECAAIAKVVWLSPQAVCFDAEWLCRKARAAMRMLLKIAPENNIGPLDVLGKCMEVVRCTLLIVMSHACTLIGFQTAKLNAVRLHNALAFALKYWAPALGLTTEMIPLDDRPVPHVVKIQFGHILFNSMIGLFSADLPGYEETHEFFMVRILNTCKLLDIRNYHDLRNHMVNYLYSPILQDKSLLQVSARLEKLQPPRITTVG